MSLSRYEIANYGIDKGKEKERGKNTSRKNLLIMIITIIKRQKRNE